MADETNKSGKNTKRKWIFLGIGILTAGLSLFGWNYFRKNKEKVKKDSNAPNVKAAKPKVVQKPKVAPKKAPTKTTTKKTTSKPGGPPPKTNTAPKAGTKGSTAQKQTQSKLFPLKKGDKNSFVKNFQQALIKKHGKTILPKFGADGSFGDELTAALRKIYKIPVNVLVNIPESLYNSTVKTKVLSGIEGELIITANATKVWKDPHTAVSVPINMVLGQQVCQRGTFTLFQNDNQYFLVETKSIKPYSA